MKTQDQIDELHASIEGAMTILDVFVDMLKAVDATHEERLAALEALITEDKIGSWRRATEAVGGRITAHDRALNELRARLDALESKDTDSIWRMPGVYSGTGDDMTDDKQRDLDAPAGQASRDGDAARRSISDALGRASYNELISELARRA